VEKPLKRAIKQLDNQEDLLSICECLHQVPHYELLEYAATHAIEARFKPPPLIFVYHQIYGRAEGKAYQVRERDELRLDEAMEAARDNGDHRTGFRISEFLSGGAGGFRLPFRRPGGNRHPGGLPMNLPMAMPPDFLDDMEEIREELNRIPPALRKIAMERMIDDFPLDDDLPAEMQRALIRMLLTGHAGSGDKDDDGPDFPLPPPRSRGGRRRS